ncbi:MAG: restriction endonuclease subunit S [Bacteroidales bacterium]|nr:restriction endonuclease subunit S [Bacteroidales bacterium]
MNNYPTYKLGEIITDAIGGDWGKDPGIQDESYELAYCIRGAEYKNWADDNGSTAVLRKIKCTNLQKRQLKEGDIIVEISGGGPEQPVGRTEVITKKVMSNFNGSKVLCTNFLRLIRPNAELVDSVFLNHYLKYFYSTGEIIKYQAGSNNLRNLKFNDYLTLPIPLPPLPTQRAIVTRIESLFTELDKGVEHLRTAQQQIKTYRQAVLNHWLNNDEGKWKMVKLGEVAEKIQIGPFGTQLHKSDYINGGIPLINPMHISNNKIHPDKSFSVSEEKYKELSNYYLQKDDVILGRRGEMGRCAVVSEKEDGMLCGTGSLYIRGGSAFCADYLCKLLCSQKIIMYFENASSGTTMSNLNRGIIENCEIPLPPLAEQQRIINEIESRLSQATASETYIENALQQAEVLRQSILKKAFEGELV